MDFILDFINQYRLFILIGLALIQFVLACLSIVFNLLIKGKIKNNEFNQVSEYLLDILPKYIRYAEACLSNGSDKQALVFNEVVSDISKKMGVDVGYISRKYGYLILGSLEDILNTPQKKG